MNIDNTMDRIHVCSAGISPCDDPTCENANSITGAAEGAVEFDGPSHFFDVQLPVGGTWMKRRHLELLGCTVVSLPFWEWDRLTGSDERKEYLRATHTFHDPK